MEAELVPQKHGGALRKGNPGARDTPAKRIKKRFQEALEAPDPSGVVSAIVKSAKEGDVAAQRLVLEYGIGKPTQSVEISGTDGGAIVIAPALAALSDEELAERAKRIARDE